MTLYADVFWVLKIYVSEALARSRNISTCIYIIFVGTFGGLAPPPPHTKKLAALLITILKTSSVSGNGQRSFPIYRTPSHGRGYGGLGGTCPPYIRVLVPRLIFNSIHNMYMSSWNFLLRYAPDCTFSSRKMKKLPTVGGGHTLPPLGRYAPSQRLRPQTFWLMGAWVVEMSP